MSDMSWTVVLASWTTAVLIWSYLLWRKNRMQAARARWIQAKMKEAADRAIEADRLYGSAVRLHEETVKGSAMTFVSEPHLH